MLLKLKKFRVDDEGAVTVDWVVLTAAIVGLGVAVRAVIEPAITSQSSNLNQNVDSVTISTEFATD